MRLPPLVARIHSGFRFVPVLLLSLVAVGSGGVQAEVQLRCDGTLLESRGSSETLRTTRRLRFNLSLEAEGRDADTALGVLQERLAAVRSALQALAVEELRVTSPSTWRRGAEPGRPMAVQANLQVSGLLEPMRLQPLVRGVGALSGVSLAPVNRERDPAEDATVRQRLLRGAYQDAEASAREVASAIGLKQLRPLEVQIEGGDPMPVAMRAMAAPAAPPFDPAELPDPKQRLSLLVRFCAR